MKNYTRTHFVKLMLIALSSAILLLGCNKTSNAKSTNEIKAYLEKEVPGLTKVDSINKSPIAGIYEVVIGRKIFYVSNDGKYLLFGNLVDIANKKNLTEQRTMELSKIDWSKLPLDLAIKEVNGNGKRKLVVFSDPDCPYCQMFEKQVAPNLTDTTIYTFLLPLARHPQAKAHAQSIWCSGPKKRSQVWKAWMNGSKDALQGLKPCESPDLDKVYNIGTTVVQLEGTPTLILENGQVLPGMLPVDQLIQQMDLAAGIVPAKDTTSAAK